LGNEIERIIFVDVIHTDSESVERAIKTIQEIKPDVVAVELDHQRYQQLMTPQSNESDQVPLDSVQGLLQQVATLEKALGNLHGSEIGSEMLAAIEEGRRIGSKIALVDRPISATMQAMTKIPLDEIYRFSSMITGSGSEIEETEFDILGFLKEDGSIQDIMTEFRKEFPGLFDVLISQRDVYVAEALHFILGDVTGKIVAILGAGHIEGVKRVLKEKLES
jgi:pheromone shutdown protein TraB